MRPISLLAFSLLAVLATGCRDRLLDLSAFPDLGGDLRRTDLRSSPQPQIAMQAFASETIVFGPGGGPSSSGTDFLVVTQVVSDPTPSSPVELTYTSGRVRLVANGNVVVASLPLDPDAGSPQGQAWRATLPMLTRCAPCNGPFTTTLPDVYRVEATFAVDGLDTELSDAADLVCSCIEAF